MKITRYFIKAEDPDLGEEGFMPAWIPRSAGFNTTDARGMIHDMVEHRLCDKGHAHEEIMAFGRIIAIRHIPGNDYVSLKGLGSEIISLISEKLRHNSWENVLPDPGPVSMSGEQEVDAVSSISEVVKSMVRESISYQQYGDLSTPMNEEAASRACRLMSLGYKDALRRYGGISGCSDIGELAFSWAKRHGNSVSFVMEEEAVTDDLFRVTVDTDRWEVRTALIRSQERTDWVRDRVNWWKGATI